MMGDVEYTPLRAPASGPAVMDIGMGLIKTSATACAQECSDTDGCNMATWTGNVPVRSQPCRLVALISFACLFDGAWFRLLGAVHVLWYVINSDVVAEHASRCKCCNAQYIF
jgi:hypothetical protein